MNKGNHLGGGMKHVSKISVCFLFIAILYSNEKVNYDPLKVHTYKLKNGLTVYLNEDHNTTSVFGAVAVRGGGKRDPKDATGIAHYLEHLLFKGTEQLGTIDYAKEKVFLSQESKVNNILYINKINADNIILQGNIKTISNDKSFDIAVIVDELVLRAIAGKLFLLILNLPINSAAICCASAALPPFPNKTTLLPFLRHLTIA